MPASPCHSLGVTAASPLNCALPTCDFNVIMNELTCIIVPVVTVQRASPTQVHLDEKLDTLTTQPRGSNGTHELTLGRDTSAKI